MSKHAPCLHSVRVSASSALVLLLSILLTSTACSPAPAPSPSPAEAISVETLLEAIRESDPNARATRLAALLESAGPDSVEAVKAAIDSPKVLHDGISLNLLMSTWARIEPAEATAWALDPTKATRSRLALIYEAYTEWARQDPDSAVKYAYEGIQVMRGETGTAIDSAIVRGWLESGKPGLQAYLRALGMTQQRDVMLDELARLRIVRDGPEATMAWAEEMTALDSRYLRAVYRSVGRRLALYDGEAAAEWCRRQCQGEYGPGLIGAIARAYGVRDGEGAMRWLATVPVDFKEHRIGIVDATRAWLRTDKAGMIAWFERNEKDLLDAPWFQTGVGMFAIASVDIDAKRSIEWASHIKDPEARDGVYTSLARWWRTFDPEAADAWIESSPLDENHREIARKPIGKGSKPAVQTPPESPENAEAEQG